MINSDAKVRVRIPGFSSFHRSTIVIKATNIDNILCIIFKIVPLPGLEPGSILYERRALTFEL